MNVAQKVYPGLCLYFILGALVVPPQNTETRRMGHSELKNECEKDSVLSLKLLIKPREGFLTIS